MRKTRIIATLGLSLALLGCNQYLARQETVHITTGDAVETNNIMQIVDPEPPFSRRRHIYTDGVTGKRAYDRYQAERRGSSQSIGPSSTSGTGISPGARSR